MADVLVYTATYGGYDQPHPQAVQDIPVDWLCLTDDTDLVAPEPWLTLPVPAQRGHPNMAAKVHKCQPPWQLGDWTHAIWIDANMEVTAPGFVWSALAAVHDGMAVWRHPRRTSVWGEAAASLGAEGQGRYDPLPIMEQIGSYTREGYRDECGLFACGTVVWTPRASETVGTMWLAECDRWGYQDQLSLPVVCWRLGVRPGLFYPEQIERRCIPRGADYLANRWLRIHPHGGRP